MLDLSKLRFADDDGAEEIRRLREGGASIRGASSFINSLIGDKITKELGNREYATEEYRHLFRY